VAISNISININKIINKNDTRKYKFLVIGKQDTYLVRHHSDSPYKYSEADIKSMLGFLVDNIYVVFGDETRSSNNPLAFLWALIVLLY
jgi:hypothetical protein